MKFAIVSVLFGLLCVATAVSGSIQLQPTPGILIPAQALRFARAAYGGSSSGSASSTYAAPAPAKSSYGAAGGYGTSTQIPAPPCPKNYVFGCQPSLTPVPCSPPAYSAPAASYSAPTSSYSAPAAGAPQGSYSYYYPQYAYPQYAVPVVRELY